MKTSNKRRTTTIMIIILTVAVTLVGCNRKAIYSHYEPIPLSGWEKNDTAFFTITPVTVDGQYEELLGLRINMDYPFTEVALIIHQTLIPKKIAPTDSISDTLMLPVIRQRCDTLHATLFTNDGSLLGKGITCYQYEFSLANVHLTSGDSLCIKVYHNMKRNPLPGLSDVGITLRRK